MWRKYKKRVKNAAENDVLRREALDERFLYLRKKGNYSKLGYPPENRWGGYGAGKLLVKLPIDKGC